jgi:hypothetical protein
MSLVVVVYPPGAGGNHLKNLLCLSGQFANSNELDPAVYDAKDRARGEVWCVGGRNLQPVFFDRMHQDPDGQWILTAHFGEMMQRRQDLARISDIRLIIMNIQNAAVRQRLQQRQTRLGQTLHPYWLDEELIWCYQRDIYARCFDIAAHRCLEIPLQDLWQPGLGVLSQIERWLGIDVPRSSAQTLHDKWMHANFNDPMGR